MSPSDASTSSPEVAHWTAERLPDLELLRLRLQRVFPEGLDGRSCAVAERAARSLYVFLYVFAIDGVSNRRVRPAMVTTMSDAQAARKTVGERIGWWTEASRPRSPGHAISGRWYAENTREPIRDETFRVWKECGALLEAPVATTSAAPRYSLARDFADLFDPDLTGDGLDDAIAAWQGRHLTITARARMALVRDQATSSTGSQIRFPDGSSRVLAAGPSTPLLKAAVETFAPAFLHQPVVLVVTESRRRLAYEDAAQLRRMGLVPDARVMPDLLLADVGAPDGELRLILMECVATAGAMTRERVAALRTWLTSVGFGEVRGIFGTVFRDRADQAFRRFAGDLAWGTFVWFASEPPNLQVLLESGTFDPQRSLDLLSRIPNSDPGSA